MIEITNITKKFGKLVALDGVSFSVGDNECFALLGFNGAGKTTLINILTTALKATGGTATIDGYDITKDVLEVRKRVNISPQEIAVAKNLTVEENLVFIADLYEIQDKQAKIEKILVDFSLTEKRRTLAKRLSGGQLKRLSIALAVLTEPKILFLDEPTLGLDVRARQKLWEMIERMKSSMTIFLTTHYLEEVERLTDRIGVISRGKMKAVGTREELLAKTGKKTLEEAFLLLTEEEEI
ncbi:MAG: ABC transporter ATP-binding protein [Clostridia bacterium]|nr:ABC transporter ATP-binding protein [Clostridia bacterium]